MSTIPPYINQPPYQQEMQKGKSNRNIFFILSGCGIVTIIMLIACAGCFFSTFKDGENDKQNAEKIVASYYVDIKNHKYQDSIRYCLPLFFSTVSREDYIKYMQMQHAQTGDLKSFILVNWFVNYNNTTAEGASTRFTLTYQCSYDKCITNEVFTLTKKSGMPLGISNRQVNFGGFKH